MSTIAGKEWYRNTFLQSDEWKLFRSQKLSEQKAKCFICRKIDIANDVHHIWYGEPSFCGLLQFVVLCRACHAKVHDHFEPCAAKNEGERKSAYGDFLIARERLTYKNRVAARVESVINPPKPKFKHCSCCLKPSDALTLKDPVGHNAMIDRMAKFCPHCLDLIGIVTAPSLYPNKGMAWKEIKECFKMVRMGMTSEHIKDAITTRRKIILDSLSY
jgi:hypothetical protein